MDPESVAQALLDAQVAWTVNRLTGDEVPELVTRLVDDALAVAETATLASLAAPELIKSIARTLATAVPPSVAASTLVERGAEILMSNPAGPYALGELVDRENVARITDEVLAMTPLISELLDDLTRSPLTATLASRFVDWVRKRAVELLPAPCSDDVIDLNIVASDWPNVDSLRNAA